ncbi:nucleoside deaminase [Bradyrhizobium cenepequi]
MNAPVRTLMVAAIEMARGARAAGDYAVGSVLVHRGQIVSRAGNRTHLDQDATQHAEMIAIRDAATALGTKNLSGCTLYSTHEPCPMCMGAIVWSRVTCVVFGATMDDHKRFRDKHGTERWRWRVIDIPAAVIAAKGEPPVELISGFMRDECAALFHAS